MERMNTRTWWILGLPLLLMATSGQAAVPDASVPLPPIPNTIPIVLGRVLSAHSQVTKAIGSRWLLMNYTYRVRVLYAIPKAPKIAGSITIQGLRTPPMTQEWQMNMPIMKPGAYFLMGVSVWRQADGFPYGDQGLTEAKSWLPFGVSQPSAVAKSDIAKLEAAMLVYSKLTMPGRRLTSAEIVKLCNSKNYFLWALGTWALARGILSKGIGGVDPGYRIMLWLQRLDSSKKKVLSPRRAFWIIHCLRRVVPAKERPSAQGLSDAMAFYLRLLATPNDPGYKPWYGE